MNRVVIGSLAVILCGAPHAFAQAGGVSPTTGGGRGLGLTVSFLEAFDGNLQADATTVKPTSGQTGGFYTGLMPTLNLTSRGHGRIVQANATLGSNMRYYGELNRLVSIGHSVAGAFSASLARRSTVSFSQAVSYAPSYSRLSGLFASVSPTVGSSVVDPSAQSTVDQAQAADAAARVATDQAVGSGRSYTSATTLGFTQAVSTRGTLSFNSGFRYTDFGGAPGLSDLRSYNAGGLFSYGLSRAAALKLGYSYSLASYSATNSPVTHDIHVGIDYQRPLTRSRKTTLAFSTGSTVVSGPVQGTAVAGETRQQFRALGDVSLTQQMGRTWHAQAAFHRGVGFIEGLTAPVATDALTMTTNGFVNRRTDLSVSAGYSKGAAALGGASDFTTYNGDVRVGFVISRMWATSIEYVYYLYDFTGSLELVPGLSPQQRRNSVRAGLTWLLRPEKRL